MKGNDDLDEKHVFPLIRVRYGIPIRSLLRGHLIEY